MAETNKQSSIPQKERGGCIIMKCSCKCEFQDKEYGVGNRVFNKCVKGGKLDGYRCTVCGTKKGR